ncbi:hypothetical protein ARMSODRAFT_1053486 [Armillaria solidipes]|uniref:superoxide dismutase n=1 Tax=Armillaria solidipes TaxID=1076256 RepID=A0A2H3B1U4_9AGAR|nr:hypothetical protein ARMSODRAFT_1053486 [Armillaria solidipes]
MANTLPDLPYSYDALVPFISQIMELHHKKHHQTYVNALNAAEAAYTKAYEFTLCFHTPSSYRRYPVLVGEINRVHSGILLGRPGFEKSSSNQGRSPLESEYDVVIEGRDVAREKTDNVNIEDGRAISSRSSSRELDAPRHSKI